MNVPSFISLLPMKKHSERVPNKNIKSFSGKPLFQTILNVLLLSKYISKVVINTDSEEIISIINNMYGENIIIHERPAYLCGDFVPMNEIIKYDLEQLDSEYFLQTHSTNPLIKSATIDLAINNYLSKMSSHDSLFSVNRLQTRLFDIKGSPINHKSGDLIRTQDLEPIYEENSNFYIFSKFSFNNSGFNRIGETPQMFEVNKLESQDIDEEEDFTIAEMIYNSIHSCDES